MNDGDDADGAAADSAHADREFVVVVVEPETPGNVGTIARAMKNFGLTDLKLVDPPEIDRDSEAYGFAGHAREDVLPNADEVTLGEVVENYHTVGTTAITGEDARRHVRFPFKTPAELRESLSTVDTDTALVFGREGTGLNNEELAQLDELISVPANPEYPVMNLGQAATVTLYELRSLFLDGYQLPDVEYERAAEPEIERFYEQFGAFLAQAESRDHKRERSERLIRRLVGRAHPTSKEATTLTGVFRRATELMEHADHSDRERDDDPRAR